MNAKPCLARRFETGRLVTTIVTVAALSSAAHAALFDFSGTLQAASLTGIPWVNGSNPPTPEAQTWMWGSIETGSGTGTSQSGFSYLVGRNPALLTFTFGDLELDTHRSPGPGTMGFERYTDTDGSSVPFTISYNGVMIAEGTSEYLYDEVSHINDFTAVGNGRVTLHTPGSDPTFYNEVSAITGGTRQLDVTLRSFFPVNNAGLFVTTGSISATPVPEPEEYAAVAAAGLIGWAVWRRRQRG
jgi:hypothetical protein